MNKKNYIYIYKCIVGSQSDICKVGKSDDYINRLAQHIRTPYYGFVPYCDFSTGNPIATVFEVVDSSISDTLLKNYLKQYQVSSLEIYNKDYDELVKMIYEFLKSTNQLISIIPDGVSIYSYLPKLNEDINDKNEIIDNDTSKKVFEALVKNIKLKYSSELPQEFLNMLKDKMYFETHCVSHFNTGNYIVVTNDYVLDLNYNKSKRIEIKAKLEKILND